AKATGSLRYAGDFYLPNMLFGKILGSPIAHGKIKQIDISKAQSLPGVKAVITGHDVPHVLYGVSPARFDEYVLAKDKVRYVGDEVAAVAAVSEEIAEQAIKLIEVEYEELPVVLNPAEAIAEGAPQLHDRYPRNINTEIHHHFGDTEKGFQEADHIREETFIGNITTHCPMESHAAISHWDEHDNLVVYTATQSSHYVHYQLSRVLKMPMGKIRIISPPAGGGFGGKAEASPLEFCTALLSKIAGQPVKMVYTRKEVMQHHRGRHKQYIKLRIGVKKNGVLTAVQNETYLDGGAYTGYGITTAYYSGSMIPTLYKIPHYKFDGYRICTNKPACGAQRGNGVPQPRFAFESLLTMIAEDLGIDPIEIRYINAMTPFTTTINELDIKSCELKATLEKVKERAGWDKKYKKLPFGKGIGIACGGFVSGAGYPIYRSRFPHSNALVKISEDGLTAHCLINAKEIGQGSSTVLAQICAETLGLPLDRINMITDDSDICPLELGSYSSRVTLMGGNAVFRAAKEVMNKVMPYAATVLKSKEDRLVAANGKIYGKEEPDKYVLWEIIAKKLTNEQGPLVGIGHYSPPEGLGGKYKGAPVGTSPAFSFGSTICEVSVDLETGKVKVERFYDFHDCGTPINPMAVHGQVEGSAVMGASETLLENMVFNKKGEIVNQNFNDYLIMTIKDAPEIFSELVDSYEPEGPFGAKEIGEGSTVPVLAAVAAAIANAIGVWIHELPITPDKILKALKKNGNGE
ncbi:MAG: 4-hydroxybenzoyl-CoA reductase subunit alpha, partial [Candidatus Fischerbacteria bacterium RBG_13_37_8]